MRSWRTWPSVGRRGTTSPCSGCPVGTPASGVCRNTLSAHESVSPVVTWSAWCGQGSRLKARENSRQGPEEGSACQPACQRGGVLGRLPSSPQDQVFLGSYGEPAGAACQPARG